MNQEEFKPTWSQLNTKNGEEETGHIVAVYNGRTYTLRNDDERFTMAKVAYVTENWKLLYECIAPESRIQKFFLSHNEVEVKDGRVTYKGKELESNELVRRIFEMIDEEQSPMPFILFMEKLYKNPSRRAVKEFFGFMQHHDIKIVEDGDVIGYKAVKSDYWDKHTGETFQFTPGNVHEIERNEVDDNWGIACSEGIHVGAWSYVQWFGNGADDRKMAVKFSPTDVVTVPSTETNKLRVCRLEVLDEVTEPLTESVYSTLTKPFIADVATAEELLSVEDRDLVDSGEVEEEVVDDSEYETCPWCGDEEPVEHQKECTEKVDDPEWRVGIDEPWRVTFLETLGWDDKVFYKEDDEDVDVLEVDTSTGWAEIKNRYGEQRRVPLEMLYPPHND